LRHRAPTRARLLAALCCFAGLSFASRPARCDESSRTPEPHFAIDPISDITLTAGGAGVTAFLGTILSTGEIKPFPVSAGDESKLLGLDRIAVTQHLDPHADIRSTIGLWSAVGFAALDPFLSATRDGWDAALVDAVMYAESLSLTETLTDLTKIAVRRPRPLDYKNCAAQTAPCTQPTDSVLSFWSGHAATVATVSATATYIAFIRAPRSPRPWITLAAGILMTSFVSYERVRSGEHFPTDVMTGALAGAAIGVLVPHSHRSQEQPPAVWVGVTPVPNGGTLNLQGVF
jgi:membrane-associated phospholipid phosphatase